MGKKRFVALFMAAVMLVAMLPAASVRPAKAQNIVRITLKWETERVFVRDDRYGNYIGYFDVEYDNNGEPFYRIGEEIHYITDKDSIERISDPGNEVVIEVDLDILNLSDDPFLTGLEFRDAHIDMRYFQYEVATWASCNGETVIESNRPLWQVKSSLRNDLVLYPATWRKLPNITYHNTYNGEVYESKGGYSESACPEIFKYPYHYLLGWSETEGGELKYHPGDEIPGESKQKTEHMDLYSVWGQSRISDIPPVMVWNKKDIERYWFGGHYWRKIGAGADKILLIYDEQMELGYPKDEVYSGVMSLFSAVINKCNELYNAFSDAERKAVCPTYKEVDSPGYIALNGDKLFLLSRLEAETYFSSREDRKFSGIHTNRWWLRGDLQRYKMNENYAIPLVSEDGDFISSPDSGTIFSYYFDNFGIVFTAGERPAFVLDLNAVLFTSAEVEVKNATPTDGSSFGSAKYSYDKDGMRKITLQDEIYKDFKATINSPDNNQGRIAVAPEETLQVSYENAVTDTEDIKNRYISAMLCNCFGEVIGYASMKPSASAGTWELKLPDLAKSDYNSPYILKIFNEQQNGEGYSDGAGPFTVFTVDVIKEKMPAATFTATGADSGMLSGLMPGADYEVAGSFTDDGLSKSFTADADGNIEFSLGLKTGTISIVKPGDGTTTDSDVQTINVTKAHAPEGLTKTDCTNDANNNGMIIGTSDAMEYRKAGDTDWTPCGGQTVAGLVNGTYYVRVKAAGAVLASEGTEVTIAESGITQDDTPETTDPGANDPSTTDPGTTDPGTTTPGATNPDTTKPDTSTPGKTDGNPSENVNGNANENTNGNTSGNEIKYDSPDGNVIEWAEGDGPIEKTVKRSEHDELCFPSYVETLVDGEKKDVPARQGSTIITLEESLLKTLSVGTHTITVVFVDGKAEVKLIIKEPSKSVAPATPVTGDTLPVVPLALVMIVTFAGAAGMVMYRRKRG